MTPRILVPVLSLLAIGGVLGLLFLGGGERTRAEDPVLGNARDEAGTSVAAADLAPAGTIDSAAIPVAEAARTAVTTSPLEGSKSKGSDVNPTTVVGLVVDEAGLPVAGATVRTVRSSTRFLWNQPSGEDRQPQATTDATGAFQLALGDAGVVELGVRAAGFAPSIVGDVVAAASVETALSKAIVLERSAVVTGVVLDTTGAPIENALVEVRDSEQDLFGSMVVWSNGVRQEAGTRTGADGTFHFDQLPRRKAILQATHGEYVAHEQAIDASEAVQLPFLTVRLDRGASIEGRLSGIPVDVTEPLTVVAIPRQFKVSMSATDRRAEVGADGTFRLQGLPVGSAWTVFARRTEGSRGMFANADERVSEVVDVEAGRRNLVLPWQAASQLTFRVVDASTLEPIEALTIEHGAGSHRSMRMSHDEFEDGNVRLEDLRPDSKGDPMHLTVDATGYEAWAKKDIVLVPGRDIDLGTIRLVPTPRMTITVLDDRDGKPVARAKVSWEAVKAEANPFDAIIKGSVRKSISLETTTSIAGGKSIRSFGPRGAIQVGITDENGQVAFDGAAGSKIELTITADGFAEGNVTDWEVPADTDADRVVRLVQGGAVLVSATDAEGRALAGRTIEHRLPEATSPQGMKLNFPAQRDEFVTDTEGRVSIENLKLGEHLFRIAASERKAGVFKLMMAGAQAPAADEEGWTKVEVVSGRTTELALVEAPRASLSGRITERGQPLNHAKVSLRRATDDSTPGKEALVAISRLGYLGGGNDENRTDRDGRYRVEGLETGDYVLEITHADRALPFEMELTLGAGETRRDVDLSVAIVAGRVVDSNGRGIAGVAVSVQRKQVEKTGASFSFVVNGFSGVSRTLGLEGGATTDASGAYEIRGVTPDVELIVAANGAAVGWQSARSEPLTVAADELARDVDLTLERAGSLDFRVRNRDETFPDFVSLELRHADAASDAPPERHFLMSGTGQVEGLAPGTWNIRASEKNSDTHADREVEVLPGETLLVELVLP